MQIVIVNIGYIKMKKYSCYKYTTQKTKSMPAWDYEIYGDDYMHGYTVIRESSEWHFTEEEADTAAKAHIDLLESGEG